MGREIAGPVANGMGAPIGECTNRGDYSRFVIAAGMLLCGLGILALGASWIGKAGYQCFGAMAVLVGIICLAGDVPLLTWALTEGTWEVKVFEEGMVIAEGGEATVLRWQDVTRLKVESFFNFSVGEDEGIPLYKYRRCTVEGVNDETFRFGGQAGEQLAAVIRERALEPMLTGLLHRYRNGETITLGNVEVSREGITTYAGFTSWEDVDEVELASGHLSIVPRGGGGTQKVEASGSAAYGFLLPEFLEIAAGSKVTIGTSRASRRLSPSFGPLVPCPYCGERIPRDAIDRIYCGWEVNDALQRTRRAAART